MKDQLTQPGHKETALAPGTKKCLRADHLVIIGFFTIEGHCARRSARRLMKRYDNNEDLLLEGKECRFAV